MVPLKISLLISDKGAFNSSGFTGLYAGNITLHDEPGR